jgi:hypothetical protein
MTAIHFSLAMGKGYISSRRGLKRMTGVRETGIFGMWKKTDSGWSAPRNLGPPVNSDRDEYYVSLTTEETIYFASDRVGGYGSFDIYRSRLVDGCYSEPENLGASVNTKYLEHDPFISPDESYILFTSVDRPGGFGTGDLYISFHRKDDTWTKAKNLGKVFNTSGYDYCPMVSPDGEYFFFFSFSLSLLSLKRLKSVKNC